MPSAFATGATACGRSPDSTMRRSPRSRSAFVTATASGRKRLPDGDGRGFAGMGESDEGCIAVAQCAALASTRPAEFGAAEPRFVAVDERANALPRLLDSAGIGTALARPPRQRGCQRMAARQRQAAPRVRAVSGSMSALSSTRGSGSVSVPVLSKMTVSASASRSMASPPLRMTPPRNNAPAATTCTAGMASAIAHGQVMMSTAMAMTMES